MAMGPRTVGHSSRPVCRPDARSVDRLVYFRASIADRRAALGANPGVALPDVEGASRTGFEIASGFVLCLYWAGGAGQGARGTLFSLGHRGPVRADSPRLEPAAPFASTPGHLRDCLCGRAVGVSV